MRSFLSWPRVASKGKVSRYKVYGGTKYKNPVLKGWLWKPKYFTPGCEWLSGVKNSNFLSESLCEYEAIFENTPAFQPGAQMV